MVAEQRGLVAVVEFRLLRELPLSFTQFIFVQAQLFFGLILFDDAWAKKEKSCKILSTF